MNLEGKRIGMIGLGQMGGGIARNLLGAGFGLQGFDLAQSARAEFSGAGGEEAVSAEALVDACDIVLTCVEGRDSIAIADSILIPRARPGQIFVDHSTVPVPETRRIGSAILERGAQYLDVPISGGKRGAAAGRLRMFAGGDRATADLCWPLFEAAGDPDKLVYCGPIGYGQSAKVVQQLTTRWPDVARLEVLTFGIKTGLDLDVIMRALDVRPDSEDPYARFCRAIRSGEIGRASFEFAEWEYFLQEVRAGGFRMPMLEAMYEFCKDAEKVTSDAAHRAEPSVWNELMKAGPDEGPEAGG